MWFLSIGPGREESSRSHDEETKTRRSAQLPSQARAGQVSGFERGAKSCILVRLCQLLLLVDLVLGRVTLCLRASFIPAYSSGWTKRRKQVDVCSVIRTRSLPQQSRILLFIKMKTEGIS